MKDREDLEHMQGEPPEFENHPEFEPDPPDEPEMTETTPDDMPPMAKPWYITPIKLPAEVREAIEETIQVQGVPLVEYIVHWMMHGAGYDLDSIVATRKLCYPDSGLQPIERGE